VLQQDDWFQADSSIICHYLIESLGHEALTSLIPSTAKLRAQMRWLEKFADYELAPRLTFTVFRQRIILPVSGKTADEELIGRALEHHIPPLLDYLTSQLGTQDYFVGHCCSLADIAITSQMINFMHAGEAIDHRKWPTLAAYFERMLSQSMWHTLVEREKVTLDKIRPTHLVP
jgi:glutathione S-transferase